VYLAAAKSGGNGSLWLIILVVLGGGYLLFIRSVQRKQRAKVAEAQNMRSALDIGVEIVTIGGLYGTVVGGDDDSVLLEISDGVTARYDRHAIARVITPVDDTPDEDAVDENSDDADGVYKTDSVDKTDGVDESDRTDVDAPANSIIETKD
jgi:preprotein translocase subunit YajC